MPEYYFRSEIIKKRKRRRRIVASLIIFILIVILSFLIKQKGSNKIEDPLGKVVKEVISPIYSLAEKDLEISHNDYAIVIKNLKTGETFLHNENEVFQSASLYKIWVMAVAYDRISKGQMQEEEILTGDLNDLNVTLEIASKSADPSPTEEKEEDKSKNLISYTTKDAIEKMITISDNYAALLVASRAGQKNIYSFLKETDLKDSSYNQPPTTTAKDMADLLEKMYRKKILGALDLDMIELMKKQQLNDRLPKYLPKDVEVAHKTGELGGNKHDAGIVFSKKDDYIIVVLSKTNNPLIAAENIANFSKDVYAYFED